MELPHDNWATFYDFVYERTYGSFYTYFTTETLNIIKKIMPSGTIIDFGAGTGRLSIPLKQQGYSVIAVEKSKGMADEFKRKCLKSNCDIPLHNYSISDYQNGKTDLALALFTVLNYSISDEELSANIKAICQHINQNGYFFFDLPDSVFFINACVTNIQSENFKRVVELSTNNENDIYTYKEICSGIYNGLEFAYEDEFRIRKWSLSTLDNLLTDNGFIDTNKTFPQFNSTGSTYKLYQKI